MRVQNHLESSARLHLVLVVFRFSILVAFCCCVSKCGAMHKRRSLERPRCRARLIDYFSQNGCNLFSFPMFPIQGRYKTQPRAPKATSMSAIHRLAHPLKGHDSIEALAPNARKRRQESVERVSQDCQPTGGDVMYARR